MDIVGRRSYPLVPDVNLFCDTMFQYLHPGIYKEAKVSLAQASHVEVRQGRGRFRVGSPHFAAWCPQSRSPATPSVTPNSSLM